MLAAGYDSEARLRHQLEPVNIYRTNSAAKFPFVCAAIIHEAGT